LDPRNWYCHFRLSSCLDAVGDSDGAFTAIDAAVRLNPRQNDPEHAHAYFLRGKHHLRAGRYEAAAADFTTHLETGTRPGYVSKRRALARFHLRDYPGALADLEEAVEQKDLSALTWIPPKQVAACPDAAFRQGVLDLATRTIRVTGGRQPPTPPVPDSTKR
jgi:tetratricopeptide (TPR) repeat protein